MSRASGHAEACSEEAPCVPCQETIVCKKCMLRCMGCDGITLARYRELHRGTGIISMVVHSVRNSANNFVCEHCDSTLVTLFDIETEDEQEESDDSEEAEEDVQATIALGMAMVDGTDQDDDSSLSVISVIVDTHRDGILQQLRDGGGRSTTTVDGIETDEAVDGIETDEAVVPRPSMAPNLNIGVRVQVPFTPLGVRVPSTPDMSTWPLRTLYPGQAGHESPKDKRQRTEETREEHAEETCEKCNQVDHYCWCEQNRFGRLQQDEDGSWTRSTASSSSCA